MSDGTETGTAWRKSGRSLGNGNCVEVGEMPCIGDWRKSSRSIGNGACVEIGDGRATIGIRDTQQAGSSSRVILNVPSVAWTAVIGRIKHGWVPEIL
jgi:Domain of unknown function (DUF397)